MAGRPISDILAKGSPSFKALGVDPSKLSEGKMLRLMLGEPRLIRRPLTLIGDQLVIGPSQRELEKALGQG